MQERFPIIFGGSEILTDIVVSANVQTPPMPMPHIEMANFIKIWYIYFSLLILATYVLIFEHLQHAREWKIRRLETWLDIKFTEFTIRVNRLHSSCHILTLLVEHVCTDYRTVKFPTPYINFRASSSYPYNLVGGKQANNGRNALISCITRNSISSKRDA